MEALEADKETWRISTRWTSTISDLCDGDRSKTGQSWVWAACAVLKQEPSKERALGDRSIKHTPKKEGIIVVTDYALEIWRPRNKRTKHSAILLRAMGMKSKARDWRATEGEGGGRGRIEQCVSMPHVARRDCVTVQSASRKRKQGKGLMMPLLASLYPPGINHIEAVQPRGV